MTLTKHQKTHTGEKPYICSSAGKTSGQTQPSLSTGDSIQEGSPTNASTAGNASGTARPSLSIGGEIVSESCLGLAGRNDRPVDSPQISVMFSSQVSAWEMAEADL